MAKYLLDSDVLIEWLRGHEPVVAWLEAREANGDLLACSPISVAEVYAGLRPREEPVIAGLFELVRCLAIDDRVGRKAGRYLQSFGSSHGVELGDALIAATAHVRGFRLCTLNRRHYPMRDLRVTTP